MLFSKRILVALDDSAHGLRALTRARLIAERMGAELELVWIGAGEPWHGYQEALEELADSGLRWQRGETVDSLERMIRQRWQQDHFALLVKGCDQRHDQPSLLAPRDWQLLRDTPCPVLLVKNPARWAGGRILAAIDPLNERESADRHNQSVLLMAACIAQQAGAELHTVCATLAPMWGAEPKHQAPALIEQNARQAVEALLDRLRLQPYANHIGEGPPHFWIPKVAKQLDASLVVIGTHARGGLKGVLLGNTAEQVLDKLETDIMVLRPGLADELKTLLVGD
ncbi:universal stress protein [Marinobacterium arenosum]|uniref:universal stress protein n=1 Tax=Marinobacterium arenosum TaxID=2862496 RepID=UPI001C94D9EA|nr:universal stress protein [Marinobacterium arenosum]MBY4677763.1 universal stress protein [Marinobacterium arenosum]